MTQLSRLLHTIRNKKQKEKCNVENSLHLQPDASSRRITSPQTENPPELDFRDSSVLPVRRSGVDTPSPAGS